MSGENGKSYKFLNFRFDQKRKKLWKGDENIALPLKSLELLELLLERNGEYVTKQEIFEKIWNGAFVEDGVLTQNIYTLRKALGTDNEALSVIENKKGFGYRITLPVEVGTVELMAPQTVRDIPLPKRGNVQMLAITAIVVFLAVSAFLIWKFLPNRASENSNRAIERIKFTKLTDIGKLSNAAISPDGKSIAFVSGSEIFLKDIAANRDIGIEITNAESFNSLQFSPDGNFLYFRNNRVFSSQAKVQKVSRLGGETQTILEKSWGSFSISPDGKKIAYFINVPPIARFMLRVRELESGLEKEFFAAEQPNSLCLECSPAWSPDGNKLIYPINVPNGTGKLFELDLSTDNQKEIKLENLKRFEQAVWLPDGKAFVVSATEGGKFLHLWKVSYPDYGVEALTNGLMSYTKVSASADGKSLLALQSNTNSNIFVTDAENLNRAEQITVGNQNYVGQLSLDWIGNDKIIYSTQTANDLTEHLTVFDLKNSSKVQITEGRQDSSRLPTSDGNRIWFVMNKNGFANIYQMDLDGKNLKQLTDGTDGQRQSPRVTNDGKFLFYVFRSKNGGSIRRLELQTNKEEVFFESAEYQPGPFMEISSDNKLITFSRVFDRTEEDTKKEFTDIMTVVSLENRTVSKTFSVSLHNRFRRFSPDNKGIEWVSAESDGSQIVRQEFEESSFKPVYTFPQGAIFNFAWSRDGKKMAISQGTLSRDAILLENFDQSTGQP